MAAKVRNTLESKDVKSNPPGVADQLNSPSVPNTSQPATNTPLRPSAASNSSTPVVVIRSIATTPGSTAVTGAGIRIASVLPSSFKVTSSNAIIRPVVSIPAVKPIILPSPVVKSSPNPADPLPGVKSESIPTAPSVPNPAPQRNIIREMQVRVPNRRDKRFSVLRFHSADHPDLSSGLELFMQRENNLKQFRSVHNLSDAPERGAGSEFGREAKEEARLRKYGIIRESYRPDDQPWIMTVGKGKTGRRRFKGVREGSVSENVEYFVFCQCKDGNFDAYPVHTWYKMKPEINYRFLREDEAEVEYNRLNKTMNLFNVMIKRKLTDGEAGEDEAEGSTVNRELGKELRYLSVATENRASTDKSSGITSGRATVELKTDGSRKSNRALKLTDLEELDSDSDIDEEAEDEAEDDQNMSSAEGIKAGSSRSKLGLVLDESAKLRAKANTAKTVAERARLLRKKQRDATIVSRMRRCVKKRKARKGPAAGSSSENDDPLDEAEDESEVDDHEGDEVDYMTNSSSDEEKLSLEDRERIYEETGVDEETGLRALLTDLSSEEENEQDEDIKAESDLDDTQDDANVARKLDGSATRLEGSGKTYDSSGNLVSDEVNQRIQQAKKKLHTRNENDALSSSSSSSSSVDGESSSYSSSSSDSDLDPDEKAKKNSKKAILFQKLSETIGTTPGTSGDLGDSVNSVSGLKRRPTETGESLTASPSSVQPAGKKSRLELPVSTTAAVTPTSTSSVPCDTELMSTVRKYLMRKPITVTELLKKIRLRKLVGKNEDAQTALANVLRQLRPIKQIINGQHALSLKH